MASCVLPALMGCDDGGSSGGIERSVPLPAEFTDTHGGVWSCSQQTGEDALSGQAILNFSGSLNRSDILHLSLLAETDGQLALLSAVCRNNLTTREVDFTVNYDDGLVSEQSRYFLAANYFQQNSTEAYQLALAPDGLTEVIQNEVTDRIEITLDPL